MVEEAVAHGVNYLYWGAWRSKRMAKGIKEAAKRNREDLIIVVHTILRPSFLVKRVVEKSIEQLGIDYLDVLLLASGGYNRKPHPRVIETAYELKDKGLIRSFAISNHNRHIFPELEKDKDFDIFHIRYNAAHRGAENEVFDNLSPEDSPGIVTFTNTRWGSLINPRNMPPGESPPSAVDCYRFALSHPQVHVSICGPNSMKQLKEDLKVLELGPMDEEEIARMRYIGDHIYNNVPALKAQLKSLSSISWRMKK
jgi:aryl-alcohol dehydrogenase-like predicted oxidoreductase